jgi:hypothetical protein
MFCKIVKNGIEACFSKLETPPSLDCCNIEKIFCGSKYWCGMGNFSISPFPSSLNSPYGLPFVACIFNATSTFGNFGGTCGFLKSP